FFFQAEDDIRDRNVTGVQTCALPICIHYIKEVEKIMNEPMFLKPVFQEKIWGGSRLKTEYNYPIPSDHTGECWAISAHPHGPATVENGEFKGQTLDEVW